MPIIMSAKNFKWLVCSCFVLILIIKTMVPVAAVFVNHFAKQIKTCVLVADQEDDNKTPEAKDLSKIKKAADEVFTQLFEFVPIAAINNLLYKRQFQVYKQTHFPPILTPPPNLV